MESADTASRPPRGPARAAADAAVRQDDAEPRLHPGLRARRARERRPVHARRALDGAGVRRAGRRRPRARAVLDAQPARRTPATRPRARATAPNPTSSRPTSTRSRRTSGAAAGPGTRDPRRGCIASASRASSGFTLRARRAAHRSVHPRGLAAASRSRSERPRVDYRIVVENPDDVSRRSRACRTGWRGDPERGRPVLDDGRRPRRSRGAGEDK